jgi:uncharacterized membrane protein
MSQMLLFILFHRSISNHTDVVYIWVTELVWCNDQNEISILEESILNTNIVLLNYLLRPH